MLFNSVDFALFLPLVFLAYWFVFQRTIRLQNLFLLVVSYVFYGWWDWRFLFLIAFSSAVDYQIGRFLSCTKSTKHRRYLLYSSLVINLGLLGFFKYFNFFVESFTRAFTFLGGTLDPYTLQIILPIGISFYTFQTLSYSIDLYRKQLSPAPDFITFAAFVSFFPQLVAGPIERATRLLPQFYKKRTFEYKEAADGARQILWGLFKKVVIADNCAYYANDIFNSYYNYSSPTLILGAVLFAFQIYGDFSGYSDMAIGLAKLFGFKLMRNFALPYFSRDIAEFWRRWHISLSTWFRDYLYIPLGGSRGSRRQQLRNILIIFLVSGFWHGARWTFIVWGGLHALYFLPLLLRGKNRRHLNQVADNQWLPSIRELCQMGWTFGWVCIGWIFFRSPSIRDSLAYLTRIVTPTAWAPFDVFPKVTLLIILLYILVEWFSRMYHHPFQGLIKHQVPALLRWSIYAFFILLITLLGGRAQEFIYFQF